MPDDFMLGQTFVFGSIELEVDNWGLLYDVKAPSSIGKICFGGLKFYFDQHDSPVCFNARPSQLTKKAASIPANLVAAGPSPTHQIARSISDNMIFWAADTRRAQKLTRRGVYAFAPAPTKPFEWSDSTITFDRTDNLAYVPHPCKFSMVVGLIFSGFRLPRVLIDGGNSVNIIFPDTVAKMGISRSCR